MPAGSPTCGSGGSRTIIFSVGVLDNTNTQTIDWNSLKDSLRPASLSQAAWNAIYPNLTAQLGSTWGDYVQKLDADAQYLAGIGENVTDISQLFGFEVQQASGYSPLASLASATDAQVAAPGLSLSFARTFAPAHSTGTSSAASAGAGPTPGTRTSPWIPTAP